MEPMHICIIIMLPVSFIMFLFSFPVFLCAILPPLFSVVKTIL